MSLLRKLRSNPKDAALALGVMFLSLAVYVATLTPSLSYKSPDGNELATVPYILGLAHSPGYPLYTWLGKLFTFLPVGDVAYRMNLMSAVMAAGTVGLLYVTVRMLTGSRAVSAFVAMLFGLSRTFWSQAVIAEVYAPNMFMAALTLFLLIVWWRKKIEGRTGRGWLWAFGLAFGLSLGTHLSSLGFALGFGLFILLAEPGIWKRPGEWGPALLGFALGCLQFLWLPYKAGTLTDALMLRHAPSTVEGIYNYTLGAFDNLKFAFPLSQLPARIGMYLALVRANFGWVGLLLGLVGMGALARRSLKAFVLLFGMYAVHLVFFLEYKAFDIDVFFIPCHYLWALFIGVAVWAIARWLRDMAGRVLPSLASARWARAAANLALIFVLVIPLVGQIRFNFAANDRSEDAAIGDFYANVWDYLPENSVLVGRGGVFGYDMFYYRLVYGVRPDVWLPMLEKPEDAGQAWASHTGGLFTTDRPQPGAKTTPWSAPPGLVPPDAWYIPRIVGNADLGPRARRLVLYEVSSETPQLFTETPPATLVSSGAVIGGARLVGYDLAQRQVAAGDTLHITLYWALLRPQRTAVSTSLGTVVLEGHELGFGNLQRYAQERGVEGLLVEDYQIVVPSWVEPGKYPLGIGPVAPKDQSAASPPQVDLGSVTVLPKGSQVQECPSGEKEVAQSYPASGVSLP